MRGAAPLALLVTACTSAPVGLTGFDEAAFVAALSIDEHQQIARGSEVRSFVVGTALDVFTEDEAPQYSEDP